VWCPATILQCSDDYGGVALHPVDIIDGGSGALLAALADRNLTTISPVNRAHPRRDVIVSGSSRCEGYRCFSSQTMLVVALVMVICMEMQPYGKAAIEG
jgi:hypothetical protein